MLRMRGLRRAPRGRSYPAPVWCAAVSAVARLQRLATEQRDRRAGTRIRRTGANQGSACVMGELTRRDELPRKSENRTSDFLGGDGGERLDSGDTPDKDAATHTDCNAGVFFLNRRRVTKDPDIASLTRIGTLLQTGP
jgi:hypothetical protein